MTTSRAVLDFIGLPVHVPGNLECRFQTGTFRDDGTWISDGSRPLVHDASNPQKEKHRRVTERGEEDSKIVFEPFSHIEEIMGGVSAHLATIGYDAPDIALIHHTADHEWRKEVLSARKDRLKVKRPELRLVVRAIGFDIEGRGELAIGLGKATVRPDGASLTQKNRDNIVLQPGDPLPLFFEACDMLAERIGYQPLCAEDRSLIEHVARKLWTNETVSRREDAWIAADAINGEHAQQARMIEFAQRLDGLSTFRDIPVGALNPEPMRIIN